MLFSLYMVKERFIAKQSKSWSGGATLMSPLTLISYVLGCSLTADSDVLGLTQILNASKKAVQIVQLYQYYKLVSNSG